MEVQMSLTPFKSQSRALRTSIVLVFCLVIVGSESAYSQTRTAANKSWPAFWQDFATAIKKKDTAALLKMMPADFFDGGGGMTPQEWLQYINENEKKGSWKDLQRSVARGTVSSKNSGNNLVMTRVTKDNHYYFEYRKDKKWWFAGVVGD